MTHLLNLDTPGGLNALYRRRSGRPARETEAITGYSPEPTKRMRRLPWSPPPLPLIERPRQHPPTASATETTSPGSSHESLHCFWPGMFLTRNFKLRIDLQQSVRRRSAPLPIGVWPWRECKARWTRKISPPWTTMVTQWHSNNVLNVHSECQGGSCIWDKSLIFVLIIYIFEAFSMILFFKLRMLSMFSFLQIMQFSSATSTVLVVP